MSMRPIWNSVPGAYTAREASRLRKSQMSGAGNPLSVTIPCSTTWLRSIRCCSRPVIRLLLSRRRRIFVKHLPRMPEREHEHAVAAHLVDHPVLPVDQLALGAVRVLRHGTPAVRILAQPVHRG